MRLNNYSDYRRIFHAYLLSTFFTCGFGTLKTFLRSFIKSENEHLLTIITFSIFPDLTRIWYYFMNKYLKRMEIEGIEIKLLIVDCSGKLDANNFPDALVERFINERHTHKLDFFFKRYIKSKLIWICDDDCFIFDAESIAKVINSFLSDMQLAAYSFFPRPDWYFSINGKQIQPLGSYCAMFKRDILITEKLSFKIPNFINPHNNSSYDTGDYMNELLLRKGYHIGLPEQQKRSSAIGGFRAASMYKILEWGCSKQDLFDYLTKSFHDYEPHVVYILKSMYTATKVSLLYKFIFGEYGQMPLFSGEELWHFVEKLPMGKYKDVLTKDFTWIDDSYLKIVDVLNKI